MDLQEEALKAYQSKDLTSALILARKALEKGNSIEQIYKIISECELETGDVEEGFTICLKLAKQIQKFVLIERLIYWTGCLHTGYVNSKGRNIRRKLKKEELDEILETVVSGIEVNSDVVDSEIADKNWDTMSLHLGAIGYWIDETPYEEFKEFATRFFRALPIKPAMIPNRCVETLGSKSELRFAGYLLASASFNEEAEELMERISVPYISKDQLETMPPGMVDWSEGNKHKIDVKNYDVPQIERTSRRLVRLTEGRPQLGRVLDIGCGTGMTSRLIRDRSDFIHGVDFNEDWLKAASEKNIFDQLDNANFLDWQQPGEKFDTIVSCMVAYLIPEFDQFVSKISSLLSGQGRAYIDVLTCSGSDGQRQLDDYLLRTREYIGQVIKDHGLRINYEHVGPNQFAVGTYMEIGRRK